MPHTAEQKAKYNKTFREKNKQYYKEYYKQNKEKMIKNAKEYVEKNKEKRKEYMKEYRQTPNGVKKERISSWKVNGVKHDDFSKLYNYYLSINNCEECNIELTYDKVRTSTTKCLDHDHDTGLFRNVLCQSCNVRRQ
tara:strand:+ start:2056 stop:2466 length:411 start_codon:yes stop_codon:yes gene_type:complete